MSLKVGVLALQGDVEEHISALKSSMDKLGIEGEVLWAKREEEIRGLDGLVIPGGESTVIGTLSTLKGAFRALKERARDGMPVMGTCAGLVVMARRVYDRVVGEVDQRTLGLLDVVVERNTFGRQRESFEAYLDIPALGCKGFKGVFIRAPTVKEIGPGVEVIARLGSHIVGVKQGNLLGLSFHPELSGDTRIHEHFLKMILSYKGLRP